MIPQVYQITRARKENADTFSIWLRPEAGDELAGKSAEKGFLPGQFNMLYVFGIGESAISISGDPRSEEECVHTIRAVGSVTHGLQSLSEGARIGVRGPFGSSWPVSQAEGKDVLLIAGGIGLAPLRPVLYQIAADREKYGRVTLLYGARTPKDLIFRGELRRFQALSSMDVEITVDHGDPEWSGNIGVVPALISRARFDPNHAVAMICGPEVMMRFAVEELSGLGLSDRSIFLSMERSMRCGVGFCGHCQFMPFFLCKDGPVFRFDQVRIFFGKKEV